MSLLNLNATGSTPAWEQIAVTPHDTNDIRLTDAVYIGSGDGTLAVITGAGTSTSYVGLVAGNFYPIRVTRILDTGTGAGDIVAWYTT
jgi:hypothetical protein